MNDGLHAARLATTLSGKYRILRCIGQGGMGSVYEAVHVVIKRRFAVKFLRADIARRRDALARFQREAAAAGAVENENIAQAVDFGIADDGSPYIVMEYLNGCDLARLLRQAGPLPVRRATDLAIQACSGIHAAHAAGVIHRDLKPANLFICRRSDETDLLKIVDFGIAKLQASDAGQAVTRTGSVFGTPSYMSPEQARGSSVLDERADVYALGVILYEMLSGCTPHPGDSHNAVIYHVSTQPPLRLSRVNGSLPGDLIDVVMRSLSTDIEQRYASAAELSQQLTPFAHRTVWPALGEPAIESEETQQSVTVISPQYAERRERVASTSPVASAHVSPKARVRKWNITLVGVAILLALLAAIRGASSLKDTAATRVAMGASVQAVTTEFAPHPAIAASRDQPSLAMAAASAPNSSSSPVVTLASAPRRPAVMSASRPADRAGRRNGRSPQPMGGSAASPRAAVFPDVRASFDPMNPYE